MIMRPPSKIRDLGIAAGIVLGGIVLSGLVGVVWGRISKEFDVQDTRPRITDVQISDTREYPKEPLYLAELSQENGKEYKK